MVKFDYLNDHMPFINNVVTNCIAVSWDLLTYPGNYIPNVSYCLKHTHLFTAWGLSKMGTSSVGSNSNTTTE